MHQLAWPLYVDTAVEGGELYCYNTEGNRNSVVSRALCRIDVTRLEEHTNIKRAILWEKNARKSHNELVEAVWNNVLLYRTVIRRTTVFQRGGTTSKLHPFCMTLDLQLSFDCPLCYNRRAHSCLLHCLHTSAILACTHSYFVVSSFKCEGKNCCYDLIPNPHIYI